MKLYSVIRVDMKQHEILRQPGVIARLRRAFGGEPQLATGKMRAALEASMLIDAQRRALAEVGAHDAVALVVDDLVLFEDRDRRPDDLGDLFLAFHEYAPAIDADFRSLRLTVEHLEAGIHYVIELQARTEYAKGDSPVRVIISGRMASLEPVKGETAEAYRARVEPILHDRVAFQAAQTSFDSFVARVRDATARALPSAQVTIPQVSIALPAPATTGQRTREPRPDDRDYDPHDAHYPNPMVGVLGLAMLGMAVMPAMPFAAGIPADGSSNTDASNDASSDASNAASDDGSDGGDADFDFGGELGW
ncbi:MAG: hypothetical protein AB7T06_33455 [Kofleriaceae bacterium]